MNMQYHLDLPEGASPLKKKIFDYCEMQLCVQDPNYMNGLSEEERTALTSQYNEFMANHTHGIISYTDEELSHIPSSEYDAILRGECSIAQEYATKILENNPKASINEMTPQEINSTFRVALSSAIGPDNKYYVPGANAAEQAMYNEMALGMTLADEEYLNSLPESQQIACRAAGEYWTAGHREYQCIGHPDSDLSHCPTDAIEGMKSAAEETRQRYLGVIESKYPGSTKTNDGKTNEEQASNAGAGASVAGAWASIRSGIKNLMQKGREAISKTAVGKWIVNTYDKVVAKVQSFIKPAEREIPEIADDSPSDDNQYDG